MNHTPGPWSVWNFSDDPRHVAVGPESGGLAVADVVACNAHGCYTAETEARGQLNALLIAAAPDMLKALQALIEEYEPNLKSFGLNAPRKAKWENAILAISRATGADHARP